MSDTPTVCDCCKKKPAEDEDGFLDMTPRDDWPGIKTGEFMNGLPVVRCPWICSPCLGLPPRGKK